MFNWKYNYSSLETVQVMLIYARLKFLLGSSATSEIDNIYNSPVLIWCPEEYELTASKVGFSRHWD